VSPGLITCWPPCWTPMSACLPSCLPSCLPACHVLPSQMLQGSMSLANVQVYTFGERPHDLLHSHACAMARLVSEWHGASPSGIADSARPCPALTIVPLSRRRRCCLQPPALLALRQSLLPPPPLLTWILSRSPIRTPQHAPNCRQTSRPLVSLLRIWVTKQLLGWLLFQQAPASRRALPPSFMSSRPERSP
jgi:hypothetical protein